MPCFLSFWDTLGHFGTGPGGAALLAQCQDGCDRKGDDRSKHAFESFEKFESHGELEIVQDPGPMFRFFVCFVFLR